MRECLLLQGLRDVSVLETDALLLSSLSFDLQARRPERVTSRSLSCFHVG